MPKNKAEVYVVSRAFVANGRRVIRRGTLLSADDPLVKGNESRMTLASDSVEQATAAPGEKRHTPQQPRNTPTKAELLEQAEEKGVEIDAGATKAEISEALEEAE